jgi:hypothetical protein
MPKALFRTPSLKPSSAFLHSALKVFPSKLPSFKPMKSTSPAQALAAVPTLVMAGASGSTNKSFSWIGAMVIALTLLFAVTIVLEREKEAERWKPPASVFVTEEA